MTINSFIGLGKKIGNKATSRNRGSEMYRKSGVVFNRSGNKINWNSGIAVNNRGGNIDINTSIVLLHDQQKTSASWWYDQHQQLYFLIELLALLDLVLLIAATK